MKDANQERKAKNLTKEGRLKKGGPARDGTNLFDLEPGQVREGVVDRVMQTWYCDVKSRQRKRGVTSTSNPHAYI